MKPGSVHGVCIALLWTFLVGVASGGEAFADVSRDQSGAQPSEILETKEAESTASAMVHRFHNGLLKMARLPTHQQREAFITPLVYATFDLGRIAAVSLGRTWRKLEERDQQVFEATLGELISATYADRFDSFNGQVFEQIEVVATRSGVVVRTRIRTSERVVHLDYVTRDNGVFNVVADGVSDLSLRRSDYAAILKSSGFTLLLQSIRDKISVAREI